MSDSSTDNRPALTLDAGGTNSSFAAFRGGKRVAGPQGQGNRI